MLVSRFFFCIVAAATRHYTLHVVAASDGYKRQPLCGSGTFVLEAAEIASGLAPGRTRSFAFEQIASFNPSAWEAMRRSVATNPDYICIGYDRDQGVIEHARANATRAGTTEGTRFIAQPISALTRPPGPPGLVIVNPPYGGRIGDRTTLRALYGTLGRLLKAQFSGWRVGLVTSDPQLARATALPFAPPGPPIPHGGLKVRLYQCRALP